MPVLRVALDLPLHRLFDYVAESASPADVGCLVRVPFAKGERVGVIVEVVDASAWPLAQLKVAGDILRDLPPLPGDFLALCEFASAYYQAAFGEVLLQALPAGLKRVAGATPDVSYEELLHVHRRFIHAPALREACARVANATLAIRNAAVWGPVTAKLCKMAIWACVAAGPLAAVW